MNTYFDINKTVISNPLLWEREIQKIARNLTENEKKCLLKICDILQESIQLHCDYLFDTEYTFEKVQETDEYEYLFKSYFEIISLNWVLITNFFRLNNIRDEIRQMLWWTINFSFYGQEGIFRATSYKIFDNAFQSIQETYTALLNLYSNPRLNEAEVYQNFFELIIENPLSDETSKIEMMGSFLRNFGDLTKMQVSLDFNIHLAELINTFTEKLILIKF